MSVHVKSVVLALILLFFVSATAHSGNHSKPIIIKKDDNGKVLVMCWNAPPEMWDVNKALTIAIKGAPKGINRKTLIKQYMEEDSKVFVFKNGGLIKMLIFDGKCMSMGYHSPTYNGPDC